MNNSMIQGNIFKQILYFAIPLYIGNMFQQFYSTVDTIIVSRTLGVEAMSAVGVTIPFSSLFLWFAMGACVGLSVVTAQFYGASDMKSVKKSVATSIFLSTIMAIVLTIISVISCRFILVKMQTPADIIERSYDYLIIIFSGIFCYIIYNFCASMLRALGDGKRPLIILVFASILNIILDFVLILYCGLDVKGAAYATILSQLISGVCCMIYIKKRVPELSITKEDLRLDKHFIKIHINSAIPMALQFTIIAIGIVIVQYALNGLGTEYVAGYTASSKIEVLLSQVYPSIGAAVVTFVAQNYGARNIPRIKKGVQTSAIIAGSYTLLSGSILIFCGRFLTKLMIGETTESILDIAQIYLNYTAYAYIFLAGIFVFRNALQGISNGRATFLAGVIELICRSMVIICLVNIIGYHAVALSGPITWVITSIYLFIEYVFSIRRIEKNCK